MEQVNVERLEQVEDEVEVERHEDDEGAEPLFRVRSVGPYIDEPVVQQNCIR